MKELLQRMSVFLRHVIEAPESSDETREAAAELEADVNDAINGNYREEEDDSEEE